MGEKESDIFGCFLERETGLGTVLMTVAADWGLD